MALQGVSEHQDQSGERWTALNYPEWSATCDTLHMHTQVLGKLCVALAPEEWQLAHAALRLTARGWETAPLRAPDGSGAFVALLDLHAHEAVIEHSDGRTRRVPLTPNRSVGVVTVEVLAAVQEVAGPVPFNSKPQEVPWDVPLDQDDEHATYDPEQVARYFSTASRAALVLAALRAPYRGRATPVNAWWGSFDLAVGFFSGRSLAPPSDDYIMRNSANAEQIEVGWWPGDRRYPRAAFFAFAVPPPVEYSPIALSPSSARWDQSLGEFILDWDDVVASPDPFTTALDFGRSAVALACAACHWDPDLGKSLQGVPRPVS